MVTKDEIQEKVRNLLRLEKGEVDVFITYVDHKHEEKAHEIARAIKEHLGVLANVLNIEQKVEPEIAKTVQKKKKAIHIMIKEVQQIEIALHKGDEEHLIRYEGDLKGLLEMLGK